LSFLATKDYALQRDYTSTRGIEESSLKDQCQYSQFQGLQQTAFLNCSRLYLESAYATIEFILAFLFSQRHFIRIKKMHSWERPFDLDKDSAQGADTERIFVELRATELWTSGNIR
jgi:hypothetical protein